MKLVGSFSKDDGDGDGNYAAGNNDLIAWLNEEK